MFLFVTLDTFGVGCIERKPIKNFGEKEAWVYPGLPIFSGTPYYLRNG